ncbi:hypothetical protein M501DRAFT_1003289 [Patellaria atrata CBS 101060]|uniref:Uncharacterized protein n=1 Tax=Patellaria atrata CBS 101060 TaxID=1346257 RepID=A0A9P4SBX8_9PEZI|nr:hypothetical protein M501DRAFT_1003289 [Patellaria atrata CBS 101060]
MSPHTTPAPASILTHLTASLSEARHLTAHLTSLERRLRTTVYELELQKRVVRELEARVKRREERIRDLELGRWRRV